LINPDPNNYQETQQIGRRIFKEGHPGLITQSARHAQGENIAVFKAEILSAPEHYHNYIYEFNLHHNTVAINPTTTLSETRM
jgi:hypothetical protein